RCRKRSSNVSLAYETAVGKVAIAPLRIVLDKPPNRELGCAILRLTRAVAHRRLVQPGPIITGENCPSRIQAPGQRAAARTGCANHAGVQGYGRVAAWDLPLAGGVAKWQTRSLRGRNSLE